MPDPNVKMTFFGNSADAERAIVTLEKKYTDLENRIKQVGKASKTSSIQVADDLRKATLDFVGLAGGIGTVVGMYKSLADSSARWRTETDAAAKSADRTGRRLSVRAGMFGPEGASLRKDAATVGAGLGLTPEVSSERMGEFVAGGFDPRKMKMTPDLMRELFMGHAAIDAATKGGAAPFDFSDTIGDILDRSKKDRTVENVRDVSGKMFALMRGSELTLPDVEAMQQSLMTAGAGKGKVRHSRALAQIGLKLGDVDLVGEDIFTALERIQAGLSKLPDAKKHVVLQEITGNAELAKNLLGALPNLSEDRGLFDKAKEELFTGRSATAEKVAAGRTLDMSRAAGGDLETTKAMARRLELAQGSNPAFTDMRFGLFAASNWMTFGARGEHLQETVDKADPNGTSYYSLLKRLLDENAKSNGNVEALLEQIRDGALGTEKNTKSAPRRNPSGVP